MGIIPPSNAGSCLVVCHLTRGPCLIRWGSNLLRADCDNHTSSGGLCFDNLGKPSVLSIQYFITDCDNHTSSGGLCFDNLAKPSVLSIQYFITNCDNHTLSGDNHTLSGGLCLYCSDIQPSLQFVVSNNLSGTATTTPVGWRLVLRLLRHLSKSSVPSIQ